MVRVLGRFPGSREPGEIGNGYRVEDRRATAEPARPRNRSTEALPFSETLEGVI